MNTSQVNQMTMSERWHIWAQYLAFGAVLFGIKLSVIHTYGNATPYWDQWDSEAAYLYQPFLDGSLKFMSLFDGHSEHRILTTRLLGLALLSINGTWNPLLQMVVNAGIHILAIGTGVALITRVVGSYYLTPLLIFSLLLFGVPYAWENTLAGFQGQFYFVLIFSMASLWLTVSSLPLSSHWWGGVVCALFAYFSLASGIFALAASALVGCILYFFKLRKTRAQLLCVVLLGGMFVLGALLTPSNPGHASLKASSFLQFFEALKAVLSWPMSAQLISVAVRNLPAWLFVAYLLWTRPPANDRRWYLFALVAWTFAQAISIAYGRAIGNLSSRYLDMFAIDILVNFACLLSLAHGGIGKWRNLALLGLCTWLVVVVASLGLYAGKNIAHQLNGKHIQSLAQEINTKNYLSTGDIRHLQDKPDQHVPYPESDRLAKILSSSNLQAILPSNIRKPPTDGVSLTDGRLGASTNRMLENYPLFILLGVVVSVLLLVQRARELKTPSIRDLNSTANTPPEFIR